jgi:hypothetical protein
VSGETLKVNPEVLQSAGTSFGQMVDGLARIQADVPLADAAGAAGQLLTADACRKAQQGVAAAVTAAVESVRKYGDNLTAAARAYVGEDESGAGDIGNVTIPT